MRTRTFAALVVAGLTLAAVAIFWPLVAHADCRKVATIALGADGGFADAGCPVPPDGGPCLVSYNGTPTGTFTAGLGAKAQVQCLGAEIYLRTAAPSETCDAGPGDEVVDFTATGSRESKDLQLRSSASKICFRSTADAGISCDFRGCSP